MPAKNGVGPEKADVDKEVMACLEEAGLIQKFGLWAGHIDWTAIRERIFAHVSDKKRIVHAKDERHSKFTSAEALVKVLLPNLPGREDWGKQADPQLAYAVYTDIKAKVWSQVKVKPEDGLQVLTHLQLGDGHFACLFHVGKQIAGVYITDDLEESAHLDLFLPAHNAVDKAVEDARDLWNMGITRRPDAAEFMDADFNGRMAGTVQNASKEVENTTRAALEIMRNRAAEYEASRNSSDDEEYDDEQDDEE